MQISDDLIKYVTKELMKRLRPDDTLAGDDGAKPLLYLVGSREHLSTPALARIQESFDMRDHRLRDDELPPAASVLITSLGIQALVRVAEGDEGSTVEGRALLTALLRGQPVAVLKDGLVWRQYRATAPKALLDRYAHYENVLTGYGVKLVDENQVVETLLPRKTSAFKAPAPFGRPAPPLAPPPLAGPKSGRRVLSESEVMTLCPVSGGEGQTLHLSAGDILTPLAQDYILAMKINLVKN